MSSITIKKEINKIIEKLPANTLADLLSYLKELEKAVRKIFHEDKEVLQKLAK